jgi:hypothetical protein
VDRTLFSIHLNEYTRANVSEELLTSTLDTFCACVCVCVCVCVCRISSRCSVTCHGTKFGVLECHRISTAGAKMNTT